MDELEILAGYLLKNKLFITTAESCTGGMIASRLVDYPGISGVFQTGYITYSEDSKCKNLGVDKKLIESFGVVSGEVARAMAQGALMSSGADIAISSTGIAGPDGGDEDHPVGLVFLGCANRYRAVSRRFLFSGSRNEVRSQAVDEAIRLALYLTNHPESDPVIQEI